MEKSRIEGITLMGRLGAGKSSTARLLAERLGYEQFTGGNFFREEAQERGMTFEELHDLMSHDESIDRSVDNRQKEFLNNSEHYIVDSRLGWFFAPGAFSVFLDLDENVAADRMLQDFANNPTRAVETHIQTREELIQANRDRVASEAERYHRLYGVEDHFAHSNFDLVVNTGEHNLEEVVDTIYEAYMKWLSDEA